MGQSFYARQEMLWSKMYLDYHGFATWYIKSRYPIKALSLFGWGEVHECSFCPLNYNQQIFNNQISCFVNPRERGNLKQSNCPLTYAYSLPFFFTYLSYLYTLLLRQGVIKQHPVQFQTYQASVRWGHITTRLTS